MNQDLLLLKNEIKKLTIKVDSLKQSKPDLLHVIQQKFMVEWTYNSNALEGNTLTLGETAFFLQQGLTSEGRPLKDFVETKNHAEAIKSLEDFIRSKQSLTEHFIKSLHAVLLKDIDHTIAQNQEGHKIKKPLQAGQYKKRPNHVLTLSGNIHHYTDPLQVVPEMEALTQWYNEQSLKGKPLEIAAELHYRFVAIHPFDDGNGRLARLLMNLVLIKAGYPPCIIQNIRRKEYLETLELVDQTKHLTPLHIFIAQELKHSLELELMVLESKAENQEVLTNQASLKLNVFQREKMILESITEPVSIGQIEVSLGVIKRPTLKKDLQRLVLEGKIKRKGLGRGILYFQ